jgi:hypothetical protein
MTSLAVSPVRYGFEKEDVWQEGQVGILLSERRKPGDRWAGKMRARARIGRHRKKERDWNTLRVPIQENDRAIVGVQFEQILVHEILDMLPYAVKEEALKAMIEDDGRKLRKIGRKIREELPHLAE